MSSKDWSSFGFVLMVSQNNGISGSPEGCGHYTRDVEVPVLKKLPPTQRHRPNGVFQIPLKVGTLFRVFGFRV